MIAELDAISEAELVASSGYLAQLRYYIIDVLFHGEPLIGLKFLLAAYGLTTKSSA